METAGHLGVNKTLQRVKERFYWPGCTKDVKDWCRACDLCVSRERPTRTPRVPLRTYNVGAPLGFERGDPVWLHNPRRKKGRTPKLQRPWEGPYLVTSCIDDLVYRIQKGPRSKPMVVHVDRLKKYQGNSFDNWLAEPFPLTRSQPSSMNKSLQQQPRALEGLLPLRELRKGQVGHEGSLPGQLTMKWTKTLFICS